MEAFSSDKETFYKYGMYLITCDKDDDCQLFVMYELSFLLQCILSKSTQTSIPNHFCEKLFFYLFNQLERHSPQLVSLLCSTLYSTRYIPTTTVIDMPPLHLSTFVTNRSVKSMSIIRYLNLLLNKHSSPLPSKFHQLLYEYLLNATIYSENSLHFLCELLILGHYANYSHEQFLNYLTRFLSQLIKHTDQFEIKLLTHFIYHLCMIDPTNRFKSKLCVRLLADYLMKLIHEQKTPHWIVQAMYGMMQIDEYNYTLLTYLVSDQYLPYLFSEIGRYTNSVQRQLYDIHYAIQIDRPQFSQVLLNEKVVNYTSKISAEYRSHTKLTMKYYTQYLNELHEQFQLVYGNDACTIIDNHVMFPHFLFDFLELKLPNKEELLDIGILLYDSIAVLPVLPSMLLKQQRSNFTITKVLNAQTTMRYRHLERYKYKVVPVCILV
ncbi:unnamed protein product [Didymodactylos carnosus]|uniref:Uncharacterized protein n=1 Tax=Didymodactylos carnosus TaxID=1234261 RepID=A0A8S2E738_9BILA|nr:unnamed protein product [Didymodactylos carnosus]CAF3835389.1 unnamed protein product [Didymodactylos carnosus]